MLVSVPLRPISLPLAYQGPVLPTPNEAGSAFISYASTFTYAPPRPEWIAREVPANRLDRVIAPCALRRYEMTEREGDPAVGTVIYVRNIHGSERDKSAHVVVNTGMYGLEVMKELRRQYNAGVRAFFEEGCSEDRVLTEAEEAVVRRIFPCIPDAPTREQLLLLYKMPLTWTFSGLVPGTHNHKVMNAHEAVDENRVHQQYQQMVRQRGLKAANLSMVEFIITQRDGRAVRELKDYLQRNPGETVVIVFGSGHRPAAAFELMDFRARLVSVWWDHPEFNHKTTMPAGIRKRL